MARQTVTSSIYALVFSYAWHILLPPGGGDLRANIFFPFLSKMNFQKERKLVKRTRFTRMGQYVMCLYI